MPSTSWAQTKACTEKHERLGTQLDPCTEFISGSQLLPEACTQKIGRLAALFDLLAEITSDSRALRQPPLRHRRFLVANREVLSVHNSFG
jgi:hypothetical protein